MYRCTDDKDFIVSHSLWRSIHPESVWKQWQQCVCGDAERKGWSHWEGRTSWESWRPRTCWAPWPPQWGGHLHQMGKEFLPASRGHWVTLLWHCWGKPTWPQGRCSELPVYAHGSRIQLHPHIQSWGAGTFICVWGWVWKPSTINSPAQCSLCCVLCVH